MSRHTVAFFVFVLLFSPLVQAQYPDVSSLPGVDSSGSLSLKKLAADAIKISGDFGANGELYSLSGKSSQRPGQSGRLYFRPSLSLFDKVTLNFDLFISSEGSGARQEINTVKFNPEWSWGKLYYGDFTMEVSKFTVTDVLIDGYGFDIYPGIFKFQAFSGRSQKAITADPTSSMFERTVYGGKIGVGEEGESHFHINFMRAYDNLKSLSKDIFRKIDTISTTVGLRIDTNYTGITPQENMIAGINWGLNLFSNSLKIKSEIAMSLFTKDMFSDAVNNTEIPKEISQYFTPRLSSNADVAITGEMAYSSRPFQLKGGYTLVGPGYTSLGMGSLINDRQIINGGLGFNVFSGDLNVSANYQRQSDNTAKQKLFTTARDNIGVVVSMRPFKPLNLTFMTNLNKMANTATNDTVKVDNSTSSYMLNGSLGFRAFTYDNTFTFGLSAQNAETKSKLRGDNSVKAGNIVLGVNTTVNKQLNTSLTMTVNSVDLGPRGSTGTNSIAAKVNQKMFNDKLSNGLSFTYVSSEASSSNVLAYQASFQLFQGSSVTLNSRATFFKGKGNNKLAFNEYHTTVDWSYRF